MFGKFFASSFTGSMMGAGADVFAVWGYVIANTVDSQVELNPELISALIGITPDRARAAIAKLAEPDSRSRSKVEEGRRLIREGEFAYRVPNWMSYRDIRDETERRAYNRDAKRRERARVKNVNDSQRLSAMSAKAEAEAEAEAEVEADYVSKDTSAQKRAGRSKSRKSGTTVELDLLSPTPAQPERGSNPTPKPLEYATDTQPELRTHVGEGGVGPPTLAEKEAKALPSWVAEAVMFWEEAVGTISYGRMGAALRPLVARWGWERVKAGMVAYVIESSGRGGAPRAEWFAGEAVKWIEKRPVRPVPTISLVKPWEQDEHDRGLARQPQVIAEIKLYRHSLNGGGDAWWTEMVAQSKRANRHPMALAHEWLAERRTTLGSGGCSP